MGKPALQSKLETKPKTMSLAFHRQFGNKLGRSRQQVLKAKEIASDRIEKPNCCIAALCFSLPKDGVVFGEALLDFLKCEMVARKKIIYRECLAL